MARRSWVFSGVLLVLTLSSPLAIAAQGFSLDLSAGFAAGHSTGPHKGNNVGISADGLAAYQFTSLQAYPSAAAVAFTVQGSGPANGDCQLLPDGSCVPGFAQFEILSVLAAWPMTRSFRIAAGPAAARAYGDWDTVRLAWATRIDLAAPVDTRLTLLLSFRGFLVPSYNQNRFTLGSLGFGLRLR